MIEHLASCNTTEGWKKQYAEVKSAPEVLPSTADYERFKNLEDQSLALPPIRKRGRGRPAKGKRHMTHKEQAVSGGPAKRKRQPPTCSVCYTIGCAAHRCKNLTAIKSGTYIPPPAQDLPMDDVIDEDDLDPEDLAAGV